MNKGDSASSRTAAPQISSSESRVTNRELQITALVFVVSTAILACEIFLMSLFALIQWHHFASMIISVALLGFGLSGTVLAMWREHFVTRWQRTIWICAVLFIVTSILACWSIPRIPFTPFRVIWEPFHLVRLLAYYVLLLVPFTSGATVIGVAFLAPRANIPHVYGANLLGSGLGVFGGLLLAFIPLDVPLSEYKSLSKTLLLPDAKIVWRAGHPLGRVDVVSAPALRVAPGLSLAYHGQMPKQEAVFVNGEGPSALMLAAPTEPTMEFVEWLPTALPYKLLDNPSVLVIGAGGGLDVLQSLRLSKSPVVALEPHPRVAGYVSERLKAPVALRIEEARGFMRATDERFDLIQISMLESFGSSSVGAHALLENHLYTVEAIQGYLQRLNHGGILSITRWLKTPPRDSIRLFATAVRALEAQGDLQPAQHLIFVRGLQSGTLLVKRTPFTTEEIATARRFCEERFFDLDHFPSIQPADANRFNKVKDNLYFVAFQQILHGDRGQFYRDYLFDIRPTTDDRPFFSQSFQWQHAGRFFDLLKRQALPVQEWGYLVLWATVAQTFILSIILIGLPLLVRRNPGFVICDSDDSKRTGSRTPGVSSPELPVTNCELRITSPESRIPIFAYFSALGLAFMLLEMALLQKFVLFLAHPIYSAAVVTASFLIFAGLGSATAWMRSPFAPLCGIIVIGLLELIFLPRLFDHLLATSAPLKVAVVVASIAPLGYFMGMPFPLMLRRVSEKAAPLVPWAWGINGCLSVLATGLAPLLAIHLGFTAVVVAGLGCYFVAAIVCERA